MDLVSHLEKLYPHDLAMIQKGVAGVLRLKTKGPGIRWEGEMNQ